MCEPSQEPIPSHRGSLRGNCSGSEETDKVGRCKSNLILPSGFTAYDAITGGLHPGEMIVIAGRPGSGKTSLAMSVAEHVALTSKEAVAFFSLAEGRKELTVRLLCSLAKVNLQKFRDECLTERDSHNLAEAASKLEGGKIYISDRAGLSILKLCAKAQQLKSQNDIKLIVIDYLQLLGRGFSEQAIDERQIELSKISHCIKALAKDLNIPIIVTVQLYRPDEGTIAGYPQLCTLRGINEAIEQDADLIGLLVQEEWYVVGEEERKKAAGKATLIIAKNNGPVGPVPLAYFKEFLSFKDRARLPLAE